jgi:hypothetical protein
MTDSREGPPKPQEIRVVDRRAFTPSGEPRTPDAPSDDHAASIPPRPSAPPERPGRKSARASEDAPAPAARDDQVASAHFQNLVLNLARQAAASLGAAKNPFTGQVEIDMEGAQQIIDLLQALRLKTRGNLSLEETTMLEGLVGDLQMQYVSVRSKAPKTP